MGADWDANRLARRLKLRDLNVLQAVAACGSMGKAAAQLSVSQPTVTKAIADLEYELAVPLLDRSPRGVTLTVSGRTLLHRCVAAFDELKQGVKDIEFLNDPTAGEVKIGAPLLVASGFVSMVIDRLSRSHPRISFELIDDGVAPLIASLAERKLDLLVVRVFRPIAGDLMNIEPLYHEAHFVVAGRQNPWARRRQVTLADLINEPWTLPAPESAYGSICADAFRAAGLDFPRTTVITRGGGHPPVRNALVAHGRFLTIMPESTIRSPNKPNLKVLPIDLPATRRPIAIITLKKRALSPVAKLFIDRARELAKPLANRR